MGYSQQRYKILKQKYATQGNLAYFLELFGTFLAEREGYKELDGMQAIYFYLVHKFHWMPKDVVGGDIFFKDYFDDSGSCSGFIFAVIDCTGHGVPGAFITMIALSAIKRIHESGENYDLHIVSNELSLNK